jgi:nucleoside 2-deoxyribosyltransferase
VDDEYRALYEDLIGCFEDRGWHVFNAHRREAWGAQTLPARTLTSMDFQDVSRCDVFVATPGADPMSPGTHIEIGWASTLGKRIFLLTERGRDYAALVTGLPAVSDVTFIPFTMGGPVGTEVSDLIEQAASRPGGQCSEDAD